MSPFFMNMVLGLMTFHKLEVLITELKNSIVKMVHSVYQPEWVKGCPETFLVVSMRVFPEISI